MGTRDSRLGAALRSVFARLRDERGIALIAALGTMTSLGLVVTGAVAFTSANSRNANESNAIQKAHALAEAGINNSLSILAAAYAQNIIFYGEEVDLLPQRTTTLNGGTVRWGGEYCTGTATALCSVDDTGLWRLESTGSVKNPTGPGAADAAYTLRARIPASMGPTKPANPIWSWVYSGAPQSAGFAESSCNMVIGNKTRIMSPLYVVGNLCLENQGSISQPSSVPVSQCPSTTRTDCNRLVTGGWLWQKSNQNYVGTAAGRLSEAHVQDGCGQNTGSAAVIANPCTWDSEKLYVSPSGRYTSIGSAQLTPPSFSWDDYYRIASPGPKSRCRTTSGTPPTFDNDVIRNSSVFAVQNITPLNGYTCKTLRGELSWDPTTRTITISGAVYIDGSAQIDTTAAGNARGWNPNNAIRYVGQGFIWVSGTFLVKNATVCATPKSDWSGCDTAAWNPNTIAMGIAANGSGGQLPADDGIQVVSGMYQGMFYATNDISVETTGQMQGPMLSLNRVSIGQNGEFSFPPISVIPSGAPGELPKTQLGSAGEYGG